MTSEPLPNSGGILKSLAKGRSAILVAGYLVGHCRLLLWGRRGSGFGWVGVSVQGTILTAERPFICKDASKLDRYNAYLDSSVFSPALG